MWTVLVIVNAEGIDEDGSHADRTRAEYIDGIDIADVDAFAGLNLHGVQAGAEDRGIGLLDTDVRGIDDALETVGDTRGVDGILNAAVGVADDRETVLLLEEQQRVLRVSGSIRRQLVERWEEAMSCCCKTGSGARPSVEKSWSK